MFKYRHIREEDYWLFPIIFVNIVCITIAIYASVILFRGPAIILGFFGIWFTSSKVRKGYSARRAQLHIATTIILGLLLAWFVYILTN